MDPYLDDHEEGVETVMNTARKRSSDANKFKRTLHEYPDLVHGSMFPETDEDIITSIIMRFLHDNIFQAIIYGSIQHYVEVISFLENNMQMSVEPKRGKASPVYLLVVMRAYTHRPFLCSILDRRSLQCPIELATFQICARTPAKGNDRQVGLDP